MTTEKVAWLELFPDEFKTRQRNLPLVYLPLGLCEPHGQISAFGLDTFKAEHLTYEAARRWGGIVAPTMNYHIHEIGPSAKFLEEHVGENNPHMTSVPSYIFLHFFLYQLRALYNAGFQAAVVLSGHGGAHPEDLRRVINYFTGYTGMRIWMGTDFDLAAPHYQGDHAGKYEISVLMYLRPELIDVSKKKLETVPGSGGRLALGHDALDASEEFGQGIIEVCLHKLEQIMTGLTEHLPSANENQMLSFEQTEGIWQEMIRSETQWSTLQPRPGQAPVSDNSRWKQGEVGSIRHG
ncbi:creatininase family protein [Paenibacillus radicis (ex Xue et al. 2023)]|uniref:Creatininase family protein n=1 Tax=Paenibacillus radicis (ex Xue et al. 2023) TaxID=2972489 RepID=A0ABT1YDJ7_9BACL|nr:creatininase family protein [Paenibacillus radicis (ex Xue et al. 2023)]MCR8630045.1 creatininase family protein [Paenibacillus radicis (ex Xue et al. 2023)]